MWERSENLDTWDPISEEIVRSRLAGAYRDPELLMASMRKAPGCVARTVFAWYRWTPAPAPVAEGVSS